jgi:hypothetical protein
MRCVAYLMMAAAEKSRINIFMVLSTEFLGNPHSKGGAFHLHCRAKRWEFCQWDRESTWFG